jgi:hypothetical protein
MGRTFAVFPPASSIARSAPRAAGREQSAAAALDRQVQLPFI